MSPIHYFYTLSIVFLLSFDPISAKCKTVTVDKSGHGDFSTIQSAIDSIPSDNVYWHCIDVKPGIYSEKVEIPYNKPYIILKGYGQRKTMLVWNQPYLESPTFSSLADNIIVKSMSFVNSYNGPNSNNPRTPAVAALVNGDKTFFHRCGFSSVQDTLWDANGRHYFDQCYIEGAVDFIFGDAQSIYEDCNIRYLGERLEPGLAGFITAQGRDSPSESNGFVFKNCNIFGRGRTFLGRPWREYSRVLFYNCRLSNVVHPFGWNAWNSVGKEQHLTFAEHRNYGPGSNQSRRVKWVKKLDPRSVTKLTSLSFISTDGWFQNMPVLYF